MCFHAEPKGPHVLQAGGASVAVERIRIGSTLNLIAGARPYLVHTAALHQILDLPGALGAGEVAALAFGVESRHRPYHVGFAAGRG